MNQSSLFTEEGRARAQGANGLMAVAALLWLLLSGGAGYLVYRYYTVANLSLLERLYYHEYWRSGLRSRLPLRDTTSTYYTLNRTVIDPKTKKIKEIVCQEGEVEVMRDEEGRPVYTKQRMPDIRLKPEVAAAGTQKYFWHWYERMSDRTFYAWLKKNIYGDQEFYHLLYPSLIGAAFVFFPGMAATLLFQGRMTKRHLKGKYIRGSRALTPWEHQRAHRKEAAGLTLEVVKQETN